MARTMNKLKIKKNLSKGEAIRRFMMCNLLTCLRFATINSSDFLKMGYSQHKIRASLSSTYKRNTLATSRFFSQDNFWQ